MFNCFCRCAVYAVYGIAAVYFVGAAQAAPVEADSIAALQQRINSAMPGDRIIVVDGSYLTTAPITVNRAGTAAQPIIIEAQSISGVEISGTHGFSLDSPAAYILIRGFKFTHPAGGNTIHSGAAHCRFTRNIFECSGAGNFLLVAGHDTEIDHNEFLHKGTDGNMIDVRGSGGQIARRVWIHHNYFHDFFPSGSGDAETIRFGLSGLSMSTGEGRIEYNLFVNCRGENELISNKSSGNTYRYNTFLNSAGAQLTLRHGNDCLVYGNYFRGTDGLRVFGDRHLIFSNYFEGNTQGVQMGNGGGEVAEGAALTSHDRPDDGVVAFNTFLNNNTHYRMAGRTHGLGAVRITVANNIFQGGGTIADLNGPYTGSWLGNICWNTGSAGDMPSSGYQIRNPLLSADANGIVRLQAASPLIDAAAGSFPFVTVDMDGQPRDANPDIGADEFSDAPVVARILTVADVGPFSKGLDPVSHTLSHESASAGTGLRSESSVCEWLERYLKEKKIADWPTGLLQAGDNPTDMSLKKTSRTDLALAVARIDCERILKLARSCLSIEPISLRDYPAPADYVGPGDFYSMGDYWWPNPDTEDGLPYVQRDGQSNPNNFTDHRMAVRRLRDAVAALTAAYALEGNEQYAQKAVQLLNVFFVDKDKRMNPHLMYAQAIPGITKGRGIGIIDTLHLAEAAIAIDILKTSDAMSSETLDALKQWFCDYLNWMTTHPQGLEEMNAKNNHAVAYWVQAAAFARLVGAEDKLELARRCFKEVIMPSQMAQDGSFPRELARTKPYGYSIFQLDNMCLLCELLSTEEDNLWTYRLPDGRTMQKAMDFLFPYLKDKSKWPYRADIEHFEDWPVRQPCLLLAGYAFGRPEYLALWKRLDPDPTNEEVQRNMAVTQPLLWLLRSDEIPLLKVNSCSWEN